MSNSRYTVVGNWSRSLSPNLAPSVLVIEDSDLHDPRTNTTYPDGAVRVRFLVSVPGFRTKTFKGETAWSDAERYARDAAFAADRLEVAR